MPYQINEQFTSVQGEGVFAGVPAAFVRLQGCRVGCSWCDTKYTWAKGGNRKTVDEILLEIPEHINHVVITGGEPTQYNLDELIAALKLRHCFVQLETSGQQWLKGMELPDWITWSPKANLEYDAPTEFFSFVNEVKWVVDEELTIETVMGVWERIRSSAVFVFMPEGSPPTSLTMEKAFSFSLKVPADTQCRRWRFSDRLQYRLGVK